MDVLAYDEADDIAVGSEAGASDRFDAHDEVDYHSNCLDVPLVAGGEDCGDCDGGV